MKKTSVLAGSLAAAAVAVFAAPGLAAADPAPPAPGKPLDGKTVFLDAGSTVASAVDQAKKVADGRGGTVPCVNPAAAAANGTPDAKVNAAVAKMVEAALQSQGAKVIMSSVNGGCVDQRADAANKSGADLALSINSAVQDAAQRGFLLETAQPGVQDPAVVKGQAVSAPAATVIRDASRAGGLVPAQYLGGKEGIAQTASALPSLVNIPLVYANLGNLANAEDAAQLTSRGGQVQYAAALTNGVIQQLTGKVVPGGAVAEPVQTPVAPADPAAIPQPAAPAAAAPAATAPALTAPAATAPALTAPAATAPAQTPLVPAVPGAAATAPLSPAAPAGTSPIVAGVPMLQSGAAPSAAVPQAAAPAAAAPAQQAPAVQIPGVGQLSLPQLPQVVVPGQQPLGLNTVLEMGPKATEFLTSQQGSQLMSTLLSSPQAFNSLKAAQGPAAAQEILKSIVSAGAILPK